MVRTATVYHTENSDCPGHTLPCDGFDHAVDISDHMRRVVTKEFGAEHVEDIDWSRVLVEG